MLTKIIIINLFVFTFSFAAFEELRVGNIDSYYEDKIDRDTLKNMIKEIEDIFEAQLGVNVFDYSQNGKPIDILFLPPSKMEDRISKKIEKYNLNQKKIDELNNYFPKNKENIDYLQKDVISQTEILNEKIKNLNQYIKKQNKRKNITRDEYNSISKIVENDKKIIAKDKKNRDEIKNKLRRLINSYNQKIIIYNTYVNQANFLSKEIESLNRSFKKVRGKTFGTVETTTKTTIKDGIKTQEKNIKSSMDRIEIYGFDNLKELKAILAHEIAHLVGIPHIEDKGALMNPIIQKNQEENLYLTQEDIRNFRKNF